MGRPAVEANHCQRWLEREGACMFQAAIAGWHYYCIREMAGETKFHLAAFSEGATPRGWPCAL